MSPKVSKWFLKYFYFVNHLLGFVVVNLNFREKCATLSMWKTFHSIVWIIFFITNFYHAYRSSYEGFEEVYYTWEAVSDTVQLEIIVTYVMVILILLLQFKDIKSSLELHTKFLRLTNVDGFVYRAFNNPVSRLMCFFAALSELGLIFLFSINLYWMQRKEKIFSLNPFRNALLNTGLIVFPVCLIARFSVFCAFCIDVVRQLVILLNHKIRKTLQLENRFDDFSKLAKEINEIEQIHGTVLQILKLFERSYGWVIVILLCVCMIVGINQVTELFLSNETKLQLIFTSSFSISTNLCR